jgi:hypothetical protein
VGVKLPPDAMVQAGAAPLAFAESGSFNMSMADSGTLLHAQKVIEAKM